MLDHLAIRNLATIESTSVELSEGLNILTGSTGAGKSILIDGLKLVLGGRARADMVRHGEVKAEVEALFRFGKDHPIWSRMEQMDLLDDVEGDHTELVVRRTLSASGKGRVTLNGRLSNVTLLNRLMKGAVDISSQHAQTMLLDPSQQLFLLDRHARLEEYLSAYEEAFRAYREAEGVLKGLEHEAKARQEREAFLRYQLDEIEKVAPEPDEEPALMAERDRLQHAEELGKGCFTVEGMLTSSDGAAVMRVSEAARVLERLAEHDQTLGPLADRLESARIELDDIAATVRDYGRGLEANPRRLEAVSTRLAALTRLKRKVGGAVSDVLEHADSLREELSRLDRLSFDIQDAQSIRDEALDLAQARAEALSKARQSAAEQTGQEVTAELEGLAMPGGVFQIHCEPMDELSLTGMDKVTFMIRTNPGEPLGPLGRIASGGEASRVLLALKRCFCRNDDAQTFIFDEVDTGVGGAVAEVVGLNLREIAQEKQVVAITHLPQIAALGTHHLHVQKLEASDRVSTTVKVLDPKGREEEISRMLAGQTITSHTRAHALELLRAGGSEPVRSA